MISLGRDDGDGRPGPGRPRLVSRAQLEDAAGELFLEQGYATTTIAQIAGRAGVSRNAFFGYFASKSDLLWVEVDDALAELPSVLMAHHDPQRPLAGLAHALEDAAARFGNDRVPLALTQTELMDARDELVTSAMSRLLAMQRCLRQSSCAPSEGVAALVGACASAFVHWAVAGVTRGPLAPRIAAALAPVVRGFEGGPASG